MAKGGRWFDHPEGEVCVMQNATTLLGVIRDRGSKGLPLERVYRYLFNQELYLKAFSRIASNEGALTPGVTAETADGMSLGDIDAIIEALRFERYRWTPARRVYIEKKNSTKKRPLGIPVWSDKLLQEVLRMILEAYFEPQFSPPFTRVSAGPRVPHGPSGDQANVAGDNLVRGGRHRRMLRQFGSFDSAVDPGRQNPRRPLPAADEGAVRGWLRGGMDVPRHPERDTAGGGCQPHSLQHLPRPPGQVRREDTATSAQPGNPAEGEPALRTHAEAGSPPGEHGSDGGGTGAAPPGAGHAGRGAH